MNSLDQPRGLVQSTIIGNPLYVPNGELLSAYKKRKSFFSLRQEVRMKKSDVDIIEAYSFLGASTLYDFFDEHRLGSISTVGRGYKDAVMRIFPEGNSFEDNQNFIDGVGVIDEALDRGYLESLYFSSALMKVIDMVVEYSSQKSELFDTFITEQIEEIGNKIEDLGFSHREVLQVTELGDAKIGAFPRGYFDEGGSPGNEKGFLNKLNEVVSGGNGGGQVVPV